MIFYKSISSSFIGVRVFPLYNKKQTFSFAYLFYIKEALMYQFQPMTSRVEKLRRQYRDTVPFLDIHRYKLVTEFYMQHRNLTGSLKRAQNFKNLCENLPCWVREDELIVGSMTATFKGSALYPEYSVRWICPELEDGSLATRSTDPYQFREEDKRYILDTVGFWDEECLCAKVNPYIPQPYQTMENNCVLNFTAQDICPQPIGHFAPNYQKAIREGFASIQKEAEAKIRELESNGMPGNDADSYNFYRSVSIVCEGMILFAKRYALECRRIAGETADPKRKSELLQIADSMDWIMEKPARNFRDAIQTLWFYQMCVLMDANMHGTSIGRVDQMLGDFAERDMAEGTLTYEEAQELIDLYYLKVAECNKAWAARTALSTPGYTSGQLITVGGTDKDGKDATNAVTYMCLEAMGRMKMHSPSQALRIHPGTPRRLWECAIAVNKINGGVPSFYSDEVVIRSLLSRGISLSDARNYCLIGCVEPSIGGAEWPACGGLGISSYTNFVNILLLALNNGRSFRQGADPLVDTNTQFGPETGYLYEMHSIDEVKEAYLTMMKYWINWDAAMINVFESVARDVVPQPVVSAAMTGCMESGRDVMYGGAKYNSTGMSGIGLGNVAESLNVIDRLCFREKYCTTRELYDALIHNWEGQEDLRQHILKAVPHYGNGLNEIDEYSRFAAESYADFVVTKSNSRGNYAAGMYPVTMNVIYGKFTAASPDGRMSGSPLSDGISAVQGLDTSGPTAVLKSVTCFDHTKYSNGILLNMKFHPTALNSEDGITKLIDLMSTYFFDLGGMEMQMNIVSADTLRDAQAHPENYNDLVVRIAGFSAYFVEVYKAAQDDLIKRTELNL